MKRLLFLTLVLLILPAGLFAQATQQPRPATEGRVCRVTLQKVTDGKGAEFLAYRRQYTLPLFEEQIK